MSDSPALPETPALPTGVTFDKIEIHEVERLDVGDGADPANGAPRARRSQRGLEDGAAPRASKRTRTRRERPEREARGLGRDRGKSATNGVVLDFLQRLEEQECCCCLVPTLLTHTCSFCQARPQHNSGCRHRMSQRAVIVVVIALVVVCRIACGPCSSLSVASVCRPSPLPQRAGMGCSVHSSRSASERMSATQGHRH